MLKEQYTYKYMKTLKEYINESLLDDDILDDEIALIEAFLEENYKGYFVIKKSGNKYIVDSKKDIDVKNKNITSLTNGLFEFGKVSGYFDCSYNDSLKDLKGAPREVSGDFYCSTCGTQFTEEDVRKVCNVKGAIYV